MDKKDGSVLVVYEDGCPGLELVARGIGVSLKDTGRSGMVKKASEVTISDILAASTYFLGVGTASATGYAEISRILAGISLAGRHAAFFVKDDGFALSLKEMIRPSGLSVSTRQLTVKDPVKSAEGSGPRTEANRQTVGIWANEILGAATA